jgi:hypothetical protein
MFAVFSRSISIALRIVRTLVVLSKRVADLRRLLIQGLTPAMFRLKSHRDRQDRALQAIPFFLSSSSPYSQCCHWHIVRHSLTGPPARDIMAAAAAAMHAASTCMKDFRALALNGMITLDEIGNKI